MVAAELLNRQWVGIDISSLAVKLVRDRIETAQGLWKDITARDDIPVRTDTGKTRRYNAPDNKHHLYGKQQGYCNACEHHFEYRHFAIDHITPRKDGGSDELGNLQLLCGSCNSIKGSRLTMPELKVELKKRGYVK